MTALECRDFHQLAPELALGLLAGDERGVALDHVATCTGCRAHLQGLVRVADDLLLLAPSVEPEIGFESQVMARLAAEGAFPAAEGAFPAAAVGSVAAAAPDTDRPAAARLRQERSSGVGGTRQRWGRVLVAGGTRRRWGRVLAAGLAAALIVVAAVAGMVAAHNRGRAGGLQAEATAVNRLAVRAVVIRADGGRSTCQLVAFPGQGAQPARLMIHLDEPDSPSSSYQVLAQPAAGGPAVLLGSIEIADGQGTLTAAIPPGTGAVNGVRILEAPHNVKYQASFAPI